MSVSDFKQKTECVIQRKRYSVRDNGAVAESNKLYNRLLNFR